MARTNHFLESLPAAIREQIAPDLQQVDLKRDAVLAEAERPVSHVILPTTAIVSVIAVMRDGQQVESRTIGRESGFGLLHALGSAISFERVNVQVAGEAYQIRLEALRQAARRHPEIASVIVRHAQATIVQSAQSTACNILHSASDRLSRWLLMTQDRLGSDILPLTQEHLAVMLGVQRTTVSTLAGDLRARKLISYSRGVIRVRDRAGLEARTCECYEAITEAARSILADEGESERRHRRAAAGTRR